MNDTRVFHGPQEPQLARVACPVDRSEAQARHGTTPYWICPCCDLWFQDPAPPKLWHGSHEAPGDAMGDDEKGVNENLARWLFGHVMRGRPGPTLDIGSHYPWLAKCLNDRGCHALAIDGSQDSHVFAAELGVDHLLCDFETGADGLPPGQRLITFVHVFEHIYDPLAALRKLRALVADDGAVFIRMPDHRVPGYERDLTEGHFTIHPMFWTLTAILQACVETGVFVVSEQFVLTPGQRDLVLRPI